MNIGNLNLAHSQEAIELFARVFADSEGQQEGDSIGELVANMLSGTPAADIHGFAASDQGSLVGAIIFTRLTLPSAQTAFILSPVAIATAHQGTGIGQQLINHGITTLRTLGVEILFTYGDPAYYGKLGFQPVSEELVQAPQPLSQPVGWLAQSLTDQPIPAMAGRTHCVAALDNPDYW